MKAVLLCQAQADACLIKSHSYHLQIAFNDNTKPESEPGGRNHYGQKTFADEVVYNTC